MKHERIGVATSKNGNPGLLLGSSDPDVAQSYQNHNLKAALNATTCSGVRVLHERTFGHWIGSPQVIIERRNGSAFVSVRPRPWGWSNVDREFLNPDSPGVDRYALKLLTRIRDQGARRYAEIERKKAAYKLERAGRANA